MSVSDTSLNPNKFLKHFLSDITWKRDGKEIKCFWVPNSLKFDFKKITPLEIHLLYANRQVVLEALENEQVLKANAYKNQQTVKILNF